MGEKKKTEMDYKNISEDKYQTGLKEKKKKGIVRKRR